jgi:hypothetical protein
VPDHRAPELGSDARSAVARAVVDDEERVSGQRRVEIADDATDRGLRVERGDDHAGTRESASGSCRRRHFAETLAR